MAPGESFVYPIKVLENDRLKLVPFDRATHVEPLFAATDADSARLCMYLPFGPFKTVAEAEEWYIARIENSKEEFLYTVFVKTEGGGEEIAGTIGLLNCDPRHLVAEIGFVMTITKYQRTFVTTNSIGLLMQYTLDGPDSEIGGLGLRRVQWQAHGSNEKSVGAAKRMGFTLEGYIRWQRILPEGKVTSGDVRPLEQQRGDGKQQRPGRHSAMLSMCWDDWLEKRADVVKLMDR